MIHGVASVEVPVSSVIVGERRRKVFGPIAALAQDIADHGLYHPIVINDASELICGERRLRAYQHMGWPTIEARRFIDVSPDELREMELNENEFRLDLTPAEANAQFMAKVREAEAEVLATVLPKPKNGRPKGGSRDAARRLSVSHTEVDKNRKQEKVYKALPALTNGWKQSHVLAAGDLLVKMRPKVSETLGEMISQPAIDPKLGLEMLENVSQRSAAEQNVIVKGFASDDKPTRTLAMTRAAKQPPNPPNYVLVASDAVRQLEKWLTLCKGTHWAKDVRSLVRECKRMKTEMSAEFAAFRDEENEKWL